VPGPTTTVTVTATPTPTVTSPTPSPSPTLSPYPPGGAADAVNLGTLGCGETATSEGTSVGSSYTWWDVTFAGSENCTNGAITLSGADVMNVYETSPEGTEVTSGDIGVGDLPDGTYYIEVYEGSDGADGQYTLTIDNTGAGPD
jgi:hypothetical protein